MNDHDENPPVEQKLTLEPTKHAFNVGIAKDFGITTALFLEHLYFWSQKNLANNTHIHDGLVWCYDTLEAIGDYFPYLTRRQIETMINNCVKEGLVARGNYNKTTYDRTCWYALTKKSYYYFPNLVNEKYLNRLFLSISQKCEMDFTEWVNGFPHYVTPIPDTDPDTSHKYPPHTPKGGECESSLFNKFWESYPLKKSEKRCRAIWKRNNLEAKGIEILAKLEIQKAKDSQWIRGYAPNPSKYLADELWNDEIAEKPVEEKKSRPKTAITPDEQIEVNKYISDCKARLRPHPELKKFIEDLKTKLKSIDSPQAKETLASIRNAEESSDGQNFAPIVAEAARRSASSKISQELKTMRAMLGGGRL